MAHDDGVRSSSFGYWVRRRRLALDLTQAALAARVGCATVTVKKLEYDERRPSRQMAERLADALSVAPEERKQFIAMGLGERPVHKTPVPDEPVTAATVPPPSWLVDLVEEPGTELPFVGREKELAELTEHLSQALAGNGRVVFVSGEAGRGKTALLTEFVRQAQLEQPDLIAAHGYCTAAAGTGDPYLPFRDLLAALTGDLETRWQSGPMTTEQARRLWAFAPTVAETIWAAGRQLVGVLVPCSSLGRWLALPEREVRTAGDVQMAHLFEQATAVLRTLARKHPLLLVIDDLQWADAASVSLLFHLGRRVSGSRILVAGAFRPSEIALAADRDPGRTLQQTILEFRRLFGDAVVDLEQFEPGEARRLTDAIVDRESNRLPESFRVRLFWQTRGHPLFLVELLREMKAAGQLVQESDGYWVEGETMDWEPGRHMRLERNPRYHGPFTGNVEEVHLALDQKPDAQVAMYAADRLDVVSNWFASLAQIDALRQRYPADYVRRPRFATNYGFFDVSRPPFADRRVRRARAMAVNRSALADVQLQGYAQAATGGFVPPGMPGHVPACGLPFDPEHARRLWAEAGYTEKGAFPRLPLFTTPFAADLVSHLAESWRIVLGIDVHIRELVPEAWREQRSRHHPTIAIGGWWADYPDPDNFLRVVAEIDMPEWRHVTYYELLERAGRLTNQEQRLQLYREAEQILAQEAPLFPLAYSPMHLLIKPWVKRYPTAAVKYPGFWKDVIIEAH